MLNCLAAGAGGFLGTVCRYLIGTIPLKEPMLFPVKTFFINLAGAFLIGMIAAAVTKGRGLDPRLVIFMKAGFCGGFTTFSTFALETCDLVSGGHAGIAAAYVILSILLGTAAVIAGQALAG